MTSIFARTFAASVILLVAGTLSAQADSAGVTFSTGEKFSETTGADIYQNVCQACHMDQGQGAVGAGRYPALAKNENLQEPSYPIYIVINGQKGMPPFGNRLDDDQIAAVVSYVRTNFGNDYKEPVTAETVKESR